MAYQALKRIKLGDRFYRPGEEVPENLDRDWGRLIRNEMVVEISGRRSKAPAAKPAGEGAGGGENGGSDGEDLGSLTRKQLDARAKEAGVDEPEKLPNKDAVLAAIAEAGEGAGGGENGGSDGDGSNPDGE